MCVYMYMHIYIHICCALLILRAEVEEVPGRIILYHIASYSISLSLSLYICIYVLGIH